MYHLGAAAAGIVDGGGWGAYGVVVGASTAVAVDTAAAAARCVEGERGERRRGAWRVVRRGQEEERERGTREGGRKRRCHSCGSSEAMEAAGFGIGGVRPAAAGSRGWFRGFGLSEIGSCCLLWAFR